MSIENMPLECRKHIKKMLKNTKYKALETQAANLCKGCPAYRKNNDDFEYIPCYDCPFWSLRVDLTELKLLETLDLLSEIESDNA